MDLASDHTLRQFLLWLEKRMAETEQGCTLPPRREYYLTQLVVEEYNVCLNAEAMGFEAQKQGAI